MLLQFFYISDHWTDDTPCDLTKEPGYVVYSSLGSFYIPLAIIIFVYLKIFQNTRRRLRKRAQQSNFQVFTIQEFKAALNHNCYSLPLWVLLMGNFSQLMMMINSSANFFIYCFMSNVFRECLHEAILKCCKVIGCGKVIVTIDQRNI